MYILEISYKQETFNVEFAFSNRKLYVKERDLQRFFSEHINSDEWLEFDDAVELLRDHQVGDWMYTWLFKLKFHDAHPDVLYASFGDMCVFPYLLTNNQIYLYELPLYWMLKGNDNSPTIEYSPANVINDKYGVFLNLTEVQRLFAAANNHSTEELWPFVNRLMFGPEYTMTMQVSSSLVTDEELSSSTDDEDTDDEEDDEHYGMDYFTVDDRKIFCCKLPQKPGLWVDMDTLVLALWGRIPHEVDQLLTSHGVVYVTPTGHFKLMLPWRELPKILENVNIPLDI